jgi:hypothetical protein
MTDTIAMSVQTLRYRNIFVVALIGVSLVAPAISIINFEITNASVYAITAMWSLLAVLGGAHVWITVAYYLDRRWLALFSQSPLKCFVIPFGLVFGCAAIMIYKNLAVGLALVYGGALINIWHHSKQNWGILSLIGKSRGVDVAGMRLTLVYAWPFFLASFGLYLPKFVEFTGAIPLRNIAFGFSAVYVVFCGWAVWRNREVAYRDPLTFLLAISLCLYFLPLVVLNGKPYALLVTLGAHATQYYLLVFMSLALSARKSVNLRALAPKIAMVVLVLVGVSYASYQVNQASGSPDLWDNLSVRVIVGLTTGMGLAHYWIDAFIWRFSDKRMREGHGDAFAF